MEDGQPSGCVQVLAGALHDNGRGKIVGETTFGKGLIQTIVELSDGSGVAVTVARYQTPDGTDINQRGIQPDISIAPGEKPQIRALHHDAGSFLLKAGRKSFK